MPWQGLAPSVGDVFFSSSTTDLMAAYRRLAGSCWSRRSGGQGKGGVAMEGGRERGRRCRIADRYLEECLHSAASIVQEYWLKDRYRMEVDACR